MKLDALEILLCEDGQHDEVDPIEIVLKDNLFQEGEEEEKKKKRWKKRKKKRKKKNRKKILKDTKYLKRSMSSAKYIILRSF